MQSDKIDIETFTHLDFLKNHIHSKDSIEIQALAGDASTRKYLRVYTAQLSFILMMYDSKDAKMAKNFLNVRSLFQQQNIFVPDVIAHSPKRSVILLEDLGDLSLERRFWENQKIKWTRPYYEKAIVEISKVHQLNLEDSIVKSTIQDDFDFKKLYWEVDYFMRNFLLQFSRLSLSTTEMNEIQNDFKLICEQLAQQPKVVCHRDYHSRNIMIHRNQSYLIDFQDARKGPRAYDLVSLLFDPYVQLTSQFQSHLLKKYFELNKMNSAKEMDEFYHVFHLQRLQRTFKACGSYASFYNDRSDRRYLKYLQPAFQSLEKCLGLLDGHHGLKALFGKHQIHKTNWAAQTS